MRPGIFFLLAASAAVLCAQTAPSKASALPRTAWGKPDFTGFWNLPYVPNMAVGKESEVPYTERGRKAFEEHDSKDDPTGNCWYPGMPRIMQSPYPVHILQTPQYFTILFEYMRLWRAIPLDNRPHPANMEPDFMGHSSGKWEGDAIVVDRTNLKDAPWTWLDTAGHQHSDVLHVIERFERTADGIAYEYTVDDPKMYSRPWTHKRALTPLKIVPGLPELIEYACTENNKDVQHLISTKPNAK
jgi:hypothetical protein